MYNERNILTMSDEEIKNSTLYIADKFNMDVKHMFLHRANDGMLAVFVDSYEDSNKTEFKGYLCKYMSGIIDMSGSVIGDSCIDCPIVSVIGMKGRHNVEYILENYRDIDGVVELMED